MLKTGKKFSKPMLSRLINGDLSSDSLAREELPRLRADQILTKIYPEYKRATLQKFIKAGYVSLDGIIIARASTLLPEDSKLALNLPEFTYDRSLPPVIYENSQVLVLDKPSGLLSMKKGEISSEATLEDFGFLVHRLDRDTSGVVILAKDIDTRALLQRQFQDRTVKKSYLAITVGAPRHPAAKINLPIARNLARPTTFEIRAGGRPAVTDYQVLAANELYSLILLRPHTGRTHQLRVHLQHLGTPILGDPVYSRSKAERLFLHAYNLEISIPGDSDHLTRRIFTAPLPESFRQQFPDFDWENLDSVL